MFHLLVSYDGWEDGADTIPTGRVYIKAGEHPDEAVLTNGELDTTKVNRLPALLMSEIGGSGPQTARLGYIHQVVQSRGETSVQYSLDTHIPGIDNLDIQRYSAMLGTRYSLNHTHWEVCSGDLFRILLMVQLRHATKIRATVFSTEAVNNQAEDLLSVMMPFGAEFDPVLKALQQAASNLGLRCVRADDIWVHHHVIQDIVDLIAQARVVACDCTGKNPNVFYEIGIAHALGKDVILITQSKDDIPFDLRHLRYVEYMRNKEGLRDLTSVIQSRLQTLTGA